MEDHEPDLRRRLIDGHPAHFFPRGARAEADAELSHVDAWLFECWLRQNAPQAEPAPAAMKQAAELLRTLLVSERELAVQVDRPSLEDLPGSSYARLLLGTSSALGINYLLLRLLRTSGLSAELFETAQVAGAQVHVVVLVTVGEARAFVDAWSDAAVFWVEGHELGPAMGEVADYSSFAPAGGDLRGVGLPPRDAFLRGKPVGAPELAVDAGRLRAFLDGGTPEAARSSEDWRSFLWLRAEEVGGALSEPARAYGGLLENAALKGGTRRLVELLARRRGYQPDTTKRDAVPLRPGRGFDLTARMRSGDVSAWHRWNPAAIAAADIDAAWRDVMARRGEPGVPESMLFYTHFPYCVSSCNFCMYWHKVPSAEAEHTRLVDYLEQRVRWFGDNFGRAPLTAAYFGGGTPTATPLEQLRRYLEAFAASFDVRGEFTVEGHPGITDVPKVELLGEFGVNRLSMGLQSLEHDVLVRITRRNISEGDLQALVSSAQAAGMEVNLDLVNGLPGQSLESFRRDVSKVVRELRPDVVSLYRFEPVARLPDRPAPEMTHVRALHEPLQRVIEDAGYTIVGALAPGVRSIRLELKQRRWQPNQMYAQFDDLPSHTIAVGPGAFGHLFGRYFFREVTALGALETGQPHYWGTAVTAVDECRSILLDALAQASHPLDFDRLRQSTGVDLWQAFGPALRLAQSRGLLEQRGDKVYFREGEGREEVIDLIVPASPSQQRSLPVIDGAVMERELVALPQDERAAAKNQELLRQLCVTLDVPGRGHQFQRGVWVGEHDGESVYFHVGNRRADPVRLMVRPPDFGKGIYQGARFCIMAGHRDGSPLSPLEQRFVERLVSKLDS